MYRLVRQTDVHKNRTRNYRTLRLQLQQYVSMVIDPASWISLYVQADQSYVQAAETDVHLDRMHNYVYATSVVELRVR